MNGQRPILSCIGNYPLKIISKCGVIQHAIRHPFISGDRSQHWQFELRQLHPELQESVACGNALPPYLSRRRDSFKHIISKGESKKIRCHIESDFLMRVGRDLASVKLSAKVKHQIGSIIHGIFGILIVLGPTLHDFQVNLGCPVGQRH